eukprot:1571740-Pyramimonas_sp.AAC.1
MRVHWHWAAARRTAGSLRGRGGSSTRFRGVNDSAQVTAEGEREVAAGFAGADANLRFQRLPKSKTPMLLSIHQREELDAVLCVKERKADFMWQSTSTGCRSTRPRRGAQRSHSRIGQKQPKQHHQLRRMRSTSGPRRCRR